MNENNGGEAPARVYLTLKEIAEICAAAHLGVYGEQSALIHRLAFELGVMHAALHQAINAVVLQGGPTMNDEKEKDDA